MQAGGYQQHGGFDPGLAALIAALLSGGVGGYGYLVESGRSQADKDAKIQAILQKEAGETLKRVEEAEARANAKAEEAEKSTGDYGKLKAEVVRLTEENARLKSRIETRGPAAVFQKATFETLEKAIPKIIEELKNLGDKEPYAWMKTNPLTNLQKVIEYPVTAKGRFGRPSLSTFYSMAVKALEADKAAKGGRRHRYRRRMHGGAEGILTEDEFATAVENGINAVTISVKEKVDQQVKDSKAKVDNRVAAKAASTLADKLTAAVAAAKAEIAKSEGIRFTLSRERQKEIDTVLDKLQGFIAEAEGNAYLAKAVEAKAKGWFRGGALSEITAENTSVTTLWNEVKVRGPKLLEDIQTTTKQFTEVVKSQKKDESASFKSPPIRFGLPTIKVSVGNPFTGLIKTLAVAKTQTEQINAIRTQSKEAVDFIKKNVKNAKTMIKEINSLVGVKAAAPKELLVPSSAEGEDGSGTPGTEPGSVASTTVVEENECTTIQADERYKTRDMLWFAKNMQAIISGGEEDVKDDTRVYGSDTAEEADLIALEPGLKDMNTGILSSTLDWFKSVRGKKITSSFDNLLAVGNAYARLRCYVDEAKELLNDPDRKTYIQRAKDALKRNPKSTPGAAASSQQFSSFGTEEDSTPLELAVRADRKAAEEARRAALTPEQRAAEDAAAAEEQRLGEWSVEYGRRLEEQRKRDEAAAAAQAAAAPGTGEGVPLLNPMTIKARQEQARKEIDGEAPRKLSTGRKKRPTFGRPLLVSGDSEVVESEALPAPDPDKTIEDKPVTAVRQEVNGVMRKYQRGELSKDETMKQIKALEEELKGKNVASQVVLREQIETLRKTLRGGRRRGSRKSLRKRTLKKRRGGK